MKALRDWHQTTKPAFIKRPSAKRQWQLLSLKLFLHRCLTILSIPRVALGPFQPLGNWLQGHAANHHGAQKAGQCILVISATVDSKPLLLHIDGDNSWEAELQRHFLFGFEL